MRKYHARIHSTSSGAGDTGGLDHDRPQDEEEAAHSEATRDDGTPQGNPCTEQAPVIDS